MLTDPAGSPAADIDAISGIVASCPGVAALSAAARSYLPGRTVPGVSVDTDRVDVYVVAHHQEPLTRVTDQLAEALATVLAGRTLYVHIEDILMPGETAPAPAG
ncbi:MAG TPA: hypothetical protein VIJ00_06730 [Nakamurella sp.]|jgi:hypothetical protein